VLESVPSCQQAVTLKFDSRNLVAFVSPQTVDVDLAKETVASTLPYYCTPALVVAMDEFPMTSRGKVDKRKLLEITKAQPELTESLA
jgi:acyl-CoA synthetase (AMP-forming)/AMP-acid ligase II